MASNKNPAWYPNLDLTCLFILWWWVKYGSAFWAMIYRRDDGEGEYWKCLRNFWNADNTEDAFLHTSLFCCLKKSKRVDTEDKLWLEFCTICKSMFWGRFLILHVAVEEELHAELNPVPVIRSGSNFSTEHPDHLLHLRTWWCAHTSTSITSVYCIVVGWDNFQELRWGQMSQVDEEIAVLKLHSYWILESDWAKGIDSFSFFFFALFWASITFF